MSDLFLLSESQLRRISPYFLLSHGVPRVDDRRVLSGIIFVIQNGLRWRDAPHAAPPPAHPAAAPAPAPPQAAPRPTRNPRDAAPTAPRSSETPHAAGDAPAAPATPPAATAPAPPTCRAESSATGQRPKASRRAQQAHPSFSTHHRHWPKASKFARKPISLPQPESAKATSAIRVSHRKTHHNGPAPSPRPECPETEVISVSF